ncbi:unnamed protein product, partial [Brassica oleracea]
TLFTEKLPVAQRQIENDPDRRNRLPATPTTEKPRSEQRRTRFATKKRNPQPKTTHVTGERRDRTPEEQVSSGHEERRRPPEKDYTIRVFG